MDLLGDDSDTELKFSINKNYAVRYDRWRQGEVLQKLKDKYGDDGVDESSSSEEEEDDDARELTKDVEKDFFKTLSCLKEKNPKIYDQNSEFFKNKAKCKANNQNEKKKKTDSFISLGEYQRNVILKKGGKFSDEEDENPSKEMTNAEQERAIKESFKDVLRDSESENENDDWGGFLKKRVKTDEDIKNEEEDYKKWLAGEKNSLKNSEEEKDFKGLRDYWTDPTLDEGEQFLRDYILNKRFLEKDEDDRVPAYDEIIHDSEPDLSADENTLEQQEEFEKKYNFRFEEPDREFIKRYPRTLEQSMRKKDDRRKRHREEVKARKEAEKAKKIEELKQLKALKKREIMEKIKKLQEITGNEDIGFQKTDIENEFDPEEHDKRMSELFNQDYYGICQDEEKPVYPELDEELEIENWDEWGEDANKQEEELHCEDPGFNMDCDYDPRNNLQAELIESSTRKKKRRQSKFAAAVAREKPLFDPKNKSFEKYIDEYYALDYEDLIGDLPCRFKYRKVVPNDFGLSIEEILAAPDKELNSWASVKKIMRRRPEHLERNDVKVYQAKAKDLKKKMKCLPSLYAPAKEEEEEEQHQQQQQQRQQQRHSEIQRKKGPKNNYGTQFDGNESVKVKSFKRKPEDTKANGVFKEFQNGECTQSKKMKKKNKYEVKRNDATLTVESKEVHLIKSTKIKNKNGGMEKKRKDSQNVVHGISDERLKGYGINPKKLKNKLKYGQKKENAI